MSRGGPGRGGGRRRAQSLPPAGTWARAVRRRCCGTAGRVPHTPRAACAATWGKTRGSLCAWGAYEHNKPPGAPVVGYGSGHPRPFPGQGLGETPQECKLLPLSTLEVSSFSTSYPSPLIERIWVPVVASSSRHDRELNCCWQGGLRNGWGGEQRAPLASRYPAPAPASKNPGPRGSGGKGST